MSIQIKKLIKGTDIKVVYGNLLEEISSIVSDSRKVRPLDRVFYVAVIGKTIDATSFIPNVIDDGAIAVLYDERSSIINEEEIISICKEKDVTLLKTGNASKTLSLLHANFYGYYDMEIDIFGITGTKGKTTASFMLRSIFEEANVVNGLIGTVFTMVGDRVNNSDHTTPEASEVYHILHELNDIGGKAMVMEVSSLGLEQNRVHGLRYKAAAFTNLYNDHVGGGEHKTFDDYYYSKLMIFDQAENAVVNLDSPRASDIISEARRRGCNVVTYGIDREADFTAKNIDIKVCNNVKGSEFTLFAKGMEYKMFVPLLGEFNVSNALCAIALSSFADIPYETIREGIIKSYVPGRMEYVPNDKGLSIIVDYAHNGEALESAINSLRRFTEGRIITVFGCGGNRPPERRFTMGEVAGRNSDFTIITSDNPRDEDPMSIIDNIMCGFNKSGKDSYLIEPDRRKAIRKAIKMASSGDTILIAGKGHEKSQEIKGVFTAFDDVEVAHEALS